MRRGGAKIRILCMFICMCDFQNLQKPTFGLAQELVSVGPFVSLLTVAPQGSSSQQSVYIISQHAEFFTREVACHERENEEGARFYEEEEHPFWSH